MGDQVRVRRLPWWATAGIGLACIVIGGVLAAEPFRSPATLAWLVAAALALTAAGELADAPRSARPGVARFVAGLWLGAAILALAWPSISVHALALAIGLALVAGGAATLMSRARAGDERFIALLSGLASIVIGGLAVLWPSITVLVAATLFGLRTALFGVAQLALAVTRRGVTAEERPREAHRWPRGLRLAGTVAVLALALGGVAASVLVHRSQERRPGAFYAAPSPLPSGSPGTLIRSEVVAGFTPGATTYRVLYLSTGYDGEPTAVSGLIVVPSGRAPAEGRPVIAFTHGTVGVASRCSPSLQGPRAAGIIEGLAAFVSAGYVVAASDYQGLGTPGPHPYLVGASEGENELDGVRAARNLAAAHAGARFAVWGHSQGGHASLFTGQIAARYAPELELVGVAAGAPVPDLVDLFKVNIKTTVGKILIAMALQSWAQVYDDASLDQIVTPAARPLVAKVATRCLYDPEQIFASVPTTLLFKLSFLSNPPWKTEPWKTIVARNNPGRAPIGAPILITQGTADPIVAPRVTEALAERLCSAGASVDLRLYPGVKHIDGGFAAVPDVLRWIGDRFAGTPAPSTC